MAAILYSPPEDVFGQSMPGVPLKSRLNAEIKAKSVHYLVKSSHIRLIEGRRSYFDAFAILKNKIHNSRTYFHHFGC